MSTQEAPPDPQAVAILLAGGRSSRMDGIDKLWADLGGEPVLARSLRMLGALGSLTALVVAAPPERHEAIRTLAASLGLPITLHCVPGGTRRRDSVAAALAGLDSASADGAGPPGLVLVHDAARPLATADLTRRVLTGAARVGAAVPGVPVTDTIKRVETGENGTERVLESVDRTPLRAVQTPQAFALALLREAHAAADPTWDATDDAAMVDRLGRPVAVVAGDPRNLKVTTLGDLELVRALLAVDRSGTGGATA